MKRKLIAMMSALVMSFSAVPYTTNAEEVTENMPEWIPQNFTEALDFDNTYGITHIEDGLICCVRRCYNLADDSNEYITEYSGDFQPEIISAETYDFVMPEKPDESDTEAYQEYLDFLHSNGINELYAENVYVDYEYEVTVYSLKPSESVEINWIEKHPQTKEIVNTTTLSFEASADGVITETDLYGWLPDTMGECYSYTKNNGEISIHDGYIVVCDEICWDGGYSMIVESIGTTDLELVKKEESYIKHIAPLGGGSKTEVRLYKPVTSGQVKVTFRYARAWEKEGKEIKKVVKYFNVDENGNISEIDDNITDGDCNGDGLFTISDVVMFQKWLSGTGELTDWKNADLNFDNKLDVFDLVLMKQAVIENMPEIDYDYKEVSKDDITVLKQEILSRYPDTDMKDFTFKYNPDNPQTYSQRKAFDIYYQGVQLKGDYNYSICASVYTRPDGLREVDMNFLKTPEEIMEVDTSVKHLSRYEMKKLLDSEEYPELTIYVNYWDKPILVYRLEDENGGGATIYDAVTGEKIIHIPYLVCVLPLEDF